MIYGSKVHILNVLSLDTGTGSRVDFTDSHAYLLFGTRSRLDCASTCQTFCSRLPMAVDATVMNSLRTGEET